MSYLKVHVFILLQCFTPRQIAEQTGISCSSIKRMIKRRNFGQFNRVKTAEMNDGCCNRRYARAIALAEKFERNTRMI